MEKTTFAAGCFWGVELKFSQVPGVISTRVGYCGGHLKNPTYEQMCTDTTGHAEVVEVTFDPTKVTFEQLIDVFWTVHDPTQLNRQGPDIGTQYRSAIFTHTPEQLAAAKAATAKLMEADRFPRPIATIVAPAGTFWPAEEYHQRYLEKRGVSDCHF